MERPPGQEPRLAHYLYAHRALPRQFLRDPLAVMEILTSADGLRFLLGMWTVLDRELEPGQQVTSDGLDLDCYEAADSRVMAVVTMPPPKRAFESHFVALCGSVADDAPARCFSLAAAAEQPGGAVLEWTVDGEHRLHEVGCPSTVEDFLDVVERLLE